jgi:site-specific DNA-methyltransferase (adenine-specific)
MMNTLHYGDNLPILRAMPPESVDLVYLDPPFNSSRSYNILFKDQTGATSDAQIAAFDDTWAWGPSAEQALLDIITANPGIVDDLLDALKKVIGPTPMLAYLVMMAARLVELRRILKPTGSLYIHCDPTASHYLKMILDAIFGFDNFRNEIIWQRTSAKGLMTRRLPSNHDTIFYYTKSDQYTWNSDAMFQPYDQANLDEKTAGKYTHRDPDGRIYRLDSLINPSPDRPNLTYEFLGITRVWRWTKERMQAAYEAGLVIQTKPGTVPQGKRYLDEQRGKPLADIWTDIPPINSQAAERLGYPTQKPLALLERIIQASSNPGDTVLDPFCGCGTAIAAAEKLGRSWIGIDITYLAITLIEGRMKKMYPGIQFAVTGKPADLASAKDLAARDRYQFQWWALSLIHAKPASSPSLQGREQGVGKKGKDQGIDGIINYIDDAKQTLKRVIVQVKSGHVKSGDIRDLVGVLKREQSEIGVFITLEPPSKDMITEAASAGHYKSDFWGKTYPRLQIITIEQLLTGATVQMPPETGTFLAAQKVQKSQGEQASFIK